MGESVTATVIEKVATATDSEALDLPPLYEAIDPDALDTVVEDLSDGELRFRYVDQAVTVTSDGTVTVDDEPTSCGHAKPAVSTD
jgi:hypothetical protein